MAGTNAKRLWIAGAALLLVAIIFAVVIKTRSESRHLPLAAGEPVYNGKPLSEWVEIAYDASGFKPPHKPTSAGAATNSTGRLLDAIGAVHSAEVVEEKESPETARLRKQASEAIRKIGSDALPFFLATISPGESPLKLQLYDRAARAPLQGADVIYAMQVGFAALQDGSKPALPALAELLKNGRSNRHVSDIALWAMMEAGDDGIAYLLEALENSRADVRAMAVIRLSPSIGPGWRQPRSPEQIEAASKRIIPALVKRAGDSDSHVRYRVAETFCAYAKDPATVIPALVTLLDDPSANVAAEAAKGLGNYGPDAKDAVPKLMSLSSDTDKRVKSSAVAALHKIQPTEK